MVYSAISVKQLLIELVALLAVGILLLRMLSRPRRRGSTPHCARCDYNLTGLTSDRCPECGTEMIPANIVYGERVRRPWLAVTSLAVAVIVMALIGRWAWDYDWYRVRPTAWVLSDLQSSGQSVKSRAWREIGRRLQGDSLSEAQHSRLIDICLAEQAANTVTLTELVDHLGVSLLDGKMSENQKATFFKQIVQLEMKVRPTVIAGGSVPVKIGHNSRGPSQPALWIKLKKDRAAALDGTPMKRPRGSGGSSGMSGCGAGGSSSWSNPLAEWEGPITAGQHRLSMTVHAEVFDSYPKGQKEAVRLHQTEIPLEASFEILATEPPGYIKLIDDPSQTEALQKAIQPKDLGPSLDDQGVQFTLECKNVPVSVAFELLGRVDGKEHRIGSMHLVADQSVNWGMSSDELPRTGAFDLILRSSKEVAMDTVDLFEMWQGELVYPGLRIEPIPRTRPSTTTATAAP